MSEGGELHLFVPRARTQAIETSLSLLAKMATVSGHVTKTNFSLDRAPEGVAHVLAIGAYGDMPEATVRAAGLDPAMLSKAWQGTPASPAPVSATAQAVQVASIGSQIELPHASLANVEPAASTGSLSSQIAQSGGRLSEAAGLIGSIRSTGIEAYARMAMDSVEGVVLQSLERAWPRDAADHADHRRDPWTDPRGRAGRPDEGPRRRLGRQADAAGRVDHGHPGPEPGGTLQQRLHAPVGVPLAAAGRPGGRVQRQRRHRRDPRVRTDLAGSHRFPGPGKPAAHRGRLAVPQRPVLPRGSCSGSSWC